MPRTVAIPAGISGSCLLALGMLGRPGTTSEIRRLLEREGETFTIEQVRGKLKYLAQVRNPPLVQALGISDIDRATVWKLTEEGSVLLDED